MKVTSATVQPPVAQKTLVSAAPRFEKKDKVTLGFFEESQPKDSLLERLKGPAYLTAAMWGAEIVDSALGGRLDAFGVTPRTVDGLLKVPLMPFVHGGFGHLIANTSGMLIAGGMIAAESPKKFRDVTLITGLTSGLGVWATGAGLTGGASGLVYGYIGYNLANGIFNPKARSIAKTAASALLFASALPGVLPGQPGISWQAHLFGLAGGIAAAALLKDN